MPVGSTHTPMGDSGDRLHGIQTDSTVAMTTAAQMATGTSRGSGSANTRLRTKLSSHNIDF